MVNRLDRLTSRSFKGGIGSHVKVSEHNFNAEQIVNNEVQLYMPLLLQSVFIFKSVCF